MQEEMRSSPFLLALSPIACPAGGGSAGICDQESAIKIGGTSVWPLHENRAVSAAKWIGRLPKPGSLTCTACGPERWAQHVGATAVAVVVRPGFLATRGTRMTGAPITLSMRIRPWANIMGAGHFWGFWLTIRHSVRHSGFVIPWVFSATGGPAGGWGYFVIRH